MFPVEKPSMLNTIARGAMGQSIPAGVISMAGLLDEEALDRGDGGSQNVERIHELRLRQCWNPNDNHYHSTG